MSFGRILELANDLELAGLLWQPEIGDEIANRQSQEQISILIDPQGLTPSELRSTYLWLPNVEQLIAQFEARQAILVHVGFELSHVALGYKTIVRSQGNEIESAGESMRISLGCALRELLLTDNPNAIN